MIHKKEEHNSLSALEKIYNNIFVTADGVYLGSSVSKMYLSKRLKLKPACVMRQNICLYTLPNLSNLFLFCLTLSLKTILLYSKRAIYLSVFSVLCIEFPAPLPQCPYSKHSVFVVFPIGSSPIIRLIKDSCLRQAWPAHFSLLLAISQTAYRAFKFEVYYFVVISFVHWSGRRTSNVGP